MVEGKINRKTHVKGPSSTSRAVIELKAQELSGPETFASDLLWDSLGAIGGLHWLLVPVRKSVQRIAQRYRHHPKVFTDKFLEIIKQRIKSLSASPEGKRGLEVWAWYNQRVGHHKEAILTSKLPSMPVPAEHPLRLTQGLSPRKLEAVEYLIPLMSALIAGQPMKVPPKTLRSKIFSLFSLQPGNAPDRLTKEIRAIDGEAHAKGRHLTDGQIARKVFAWYAQDKAWHKGRARQTVKDARLPCSCRLVS